jgi:hypothetical protein
VSVGRLVAEIRRRDPRYHAAQVAADPLLDACRSR